MELETLVTVGTVVTFVGYISNQLVDVIKPRLKELAPEAHRNTVGRLLALAITAVLAVAAGFGAEALGYIEPGGGWLVFGAVFPATGVWFQIDSRRQISKEAIRPVYWSGQEEDEVG